MVKARRVGHATFETPDLEKAITYYGEFMGLIVAEREKDRAFLATKIGQLVIELNKADRAHCIKLSFEVAANSDFGELARELSKDGVRSELRNDSVPGMGQVLSFKDDKGTIIDLFKDWSYLAKHAQVAGVGPLKLGHVAFFTPDIQRTVAFYERVLGFRVSDWIGDFFCFMRCNTDHHTVNFFTGPDVKLHHIAFELKDFMHLQNSCDVMGQKQVPIIWGPLRHGPGHNVATYHRNPDDHGPSAGRRARPTCGAPRRRRISTGHSDAERSDSQFWRLPLRAHRRRFDRHAARAPHQVKLEIDKFARSVGIRDRAHAEQTVAQPPLQRSERLPLEAIERISGRMALRDRRAGKLLAPIVVVALRAGEIELALALYEHRAAGFQKRPYPRVIRDVDRHAARLLPDIGCERQQLLAFEGKRGRALLLSAAHIDPLFEIDRAAAHRVECGIARRHAFHARARVAVAVRA